jgi:transmembrane sensor
MNEADAEPIPQAVHDAAGEWLTRLHKDVGADVHAAFETWLSADPRHRRAYELARRDWQLSQLLKDRPIGQGRALPRAPFYMRQRTHVLAAGLGALLLLGGGTALILRTNAPLGLSQPAYAATLETALGEIRTIRMPDGSQIILDTASRLRVRYTKAERRIVLEAGRARFGVSGDSARPFHVVVPGGDIVARNTLFDVSLLGSVPKVTSLEGTVELRSHQGKSGPALAAGQAQSIGGQIHGARAGEAGWVSGMLALEATPLGDAIASVNRYNIVQLRLGDPALAGLRISGAFRVHDPKGFARAVAASLHLHVRQPDARTVLLAR